MFYCFCFISNVKVQISESRVFDIAKKCHRYDINQQIDKPVWCRHLTDGHMIIVLQMASVSHGSIQI